MAIYENLPVFKASYDLLLEVHRMNINLTREYRHTVGENLKNELMELITTIYEANSTDDVEKVRSLREACRNILRVKIYMRVLHDLKQITTKHFVAMCEKTESISKQTTAWRKSTVERVRKMHANREE
jgi:hypothetical protein